MKIAKFSIYGGIQAKERPRARVVGGKYAVMYTPKNTVIYENLVKTEYRNQCKDTWFGDSPLEVIVHAYFALPKVLEKYKDCRDLKCTCHKDLDNIAKTILDALNKVAYADDKQIFFLNIKKSYAVDGIEKVDVEIYEEFGSIDDIKKQHQARKELEKYQELSSKTNLTKSQKETLEKLKYKIFKNHEIGEEKL